MISAIEILVDPELLAEAQSLFRTVILGALGLLGTILTFGLAFLSTKIDAWLKAKTEKAQSDAKSAKATAHHKALECFNAKLLSLSTSAVAEVEQTLVRQLKADGTWNAKTAMNARDTAVEVMKRHVGENGLAEMRDCSGLAIAAIEGVFRTWVEMAVGGNSDKTENAPIVPMNEAP